MFRFEHVMRSQNRYADALATLASKVDVAEVIIKAKGQMRLQDHCSTEDQWIQEIKTRIMEGKVTNYKLMRHFHVDNNVLYYKAPSGILARCLSKE